MRRWIVSPLLFLATSSSSVVVSGALARSVPWVILTLGSSAGATRTASFVWGKVYRGGADTASEDFETEQSHHAEEEVEDVSNEDEGSVEEEEDVGPVVEVATEASEEPETSGTEPGSSETTDVFQDASVGTEDITLVEDDSAAHVDRMEYADDEGSEETTTLDETADPETEDPEPTPAAAVEVAISPLTDETAPSVGKNDSVVTDETKAALSKLQYRQREIQGLRPEIAEHLVENQLTRPPEGIPDGWYREEASPRQRQRQRQQRSSSAIERQMPRLTRARIQRMVPVAAGVLVIGVGVQTGSLALVAAKVGALLASGGPSSPTATTQSWETVPPSHHTEAESEEGTMEDHKDKMATAATDAPPSAVPTNAYTHSTGDIHPHSIRPGSRTANDTLDITWLDKAITAVERRIKAFLRMEI